MFGYQKPHYVHQQVTFCFHLPFDAGKVVYLALRCSGKSEPEQ